MRAKDGLDEMRLERKKEREKGRKGQKEGRMKE